MKELAPPAGRFVTAALQGTPHRPETQRHSSRKQHGAQANATQLIHLETAAIKSKDNTILYEHTYLRRSLNPSS